MDTTLTTGTDEAAVEALRTAVLVSWIKSEPLGDAVLAALRADPAAARAVRDAIDPDGLRAALELTRGVLGLEPTDEEVREYRLDARDPENRRLNYAEWRSHRLLEGTPDAD